MDLHTSTDTHALRLSTSHICYMCVCIPAYVPASSFCATQSDTRAHMTVSACMRTHTWTCGYHALLHVVPPCHMICMSRLHTSLKHSASHTCVCNVLTVGHMLSMRAYVFQMCEAHATAAYCCVDYLTVLTAHHISVRQSSCSLVQNSCPCLKHRHFKLRLSISWPSAHHACH